MITYTIRTDVKGKRTLETDAVFTTGDVQAYRLQFVFYDNGVYDATGCNLVVKGKRPDGIVVIDEGVVDELGNAFYDVKSSMYAVAGKLSLEVALLTKDGGYLTVKELTISVREGFGEGELAEDATPLLTELHDTLAEAKEITEKARPVADVVAAEELRNKREEQRLQSETERVAAEEMRSEAEGLRQAAEGERASAEMERVAAETERQAGYAEMQNVFANALKGSASGASIHLDDVSPVEHKAEVKVSGVENLEDVTLIQNGKNLSKNVTRNDTGSSSVKITIDNNLLTFDGEDMSRNTGVYTVNDENGCFFLQPGTYTISLQYVGGVCNAIGGDGVFYVGLHKIGTNNKTSFIGIYAKSTTNRSKTFTITEANWYYVYFVGNGDFENLQYHIQVETGSSCTPYEEYKETKYTVNADGTVDNVVLYHPYTSLLSDTNGAAISCEYNKDTNKVMEKLTNAIISLGGNV